MLGKNQVKRLMESPRLIAGLGVAAVLAYIVWIGGPYLRSIIVRDAAVNRGNLGHRALNLNCGRENRSCAWVPGNSRRIDRSSLIRACYRRFHLLRCAGEVSIKIAELMSSIICRFS